MSDRFAQRPGEERLPDIPPADAGVVFIGRIRSPWTLQDCPRNLVRARETGQGARLEIAPAYRAGLDGLEAGCALVLLYWMDAAPRDLIRQHPRHRERPTGTFALRSPARPNPIALATVRCIAIDRKHGLIGIDAIDAVDGTPLLDIKPHLPTIDLPPAAGDGCGSA